MGVLVDVAQGGRLGAGTRIEVGTEPPTVEAVEYELDVEVRDDLIACGPVVLLSERLAVRLECDGLRGVELVPAAMLPAPAEHDWALEHLPPDAPDAYRWVRATAHGDPDLRVDELTRHAARSGDPVWLITTRARSRDDVERLHRRIADALRPGDQLARTGLLDGGTVAVSASAGMFWQTGLVEYLLVDDVL